MKFHQNTTMEGLKSKGIPTFNQCEHYLIEPHPNTMQTIVIALEGGKHMTINIHPQADNVDVKMHGEHNHTHFSQGECKNTNNADGVHAFFNMRGSYK